MTARRSPRRAGTALRAALGDSAPQTLLARVQSVWAEACGPAIAAEAQPVGERQGTVTVACRSATWASELDLMQDDLRSRLNEALGDEPVSGMRFTADGARHGLA